MPTLYNRIDENKRETILFIAVFLLFLAIAIYIIDLLFFHNRVILFLTIVGSVIFSLGNLFYSTSLILRQNRALPLDPETNKEVYNSMENLCIAAGLPVPKIYYTNDSAINAFTVGRNPKNASIVFTQGALADLNKAELEGVMAHELSHIENHDILLATTLAFLLGFIRSIVNLVKRLINTLFSFLMASGGDWISALSRLLLLLLFYSAVIF
jgi:heat shock protein HtpX